jgi:hypothetical protein
MYKLASSSLHLQINHGSLLTRQFSETCWRLGRCGRQNGYSRHTVHVPAIN